MILEPAIDKRVTKIQDSQAVEWKSIHSHPSHNLCQQEHIERKKIEQQGGGASEINLIPEVLQFF